MFFIIYSLKKKSNNHKEISKKNSSKPKESMHDKSEKQKVSFKPDIEDKKGYKYKYIYREFKINLQKLKKLKTQLKLKREILLQR